MADNSATFLNNEIKSRFLTTDPLYQILFAKEQDYTLPVSHPRDFDIGAVANVLEYVKKLAQYYISQSNLNNAEDEFLEFLSSYFYGRFRRTGETDAQLVQRIKNEIIGQRETIWNILNAVIPYNGSGSPKYPFILEFEAIFDLSMVSDYSATDNYKRYKTPKPNVFPAYAGGEGVTTSVQRYYFALYMLDVATSDMQIVYDIVDRMKASGIAFSVYFLTDDIYG